MALLAAAERLRALCYLYVGKLVSSVVTILRPHLFDLSDPWPTIAKVVAPVCFLAAIVWIGMGSPGWRPWVPLTVFSLPAWPLLLSVMVLPTADGVEYTRAWSWHRVPYDEIIACGRSWHPWLGYLELRRRRFWGRRLYFVLGDRPEP